MAFHGVLGEICMATRPTLTSRTLQMTGSWSDLTNNISHMTKR
jgi:hypothetical protein